MSAHTSVHARGIALLIGLSISVLLAWWALGARYEARASSPIVLLEPHTELEVLMAEGARPGGLEDRRWVERFPESPLRRFEIDRATPEQARLSAARPGTRLEVLNGGCTGHSFYDYLGTAERYAYAGPKVLLVIVYGGNDFNEMLTLHHIFNGTVRPPGPESLEGTMQAAAAIDPAALGQCFWTLEYFRMNPDEIALALEGSLNVMREIRLLADALGAELAVAYPPPATDFPWERNREAFEGIAEILELGPEDLACTRNMSRAFLEGVRGLATVIDLTKNLAVAGDASYWQTDQHINVAGNRVIAARLAVTIPQLLE